MTFTEFLDLAGLIFLFLGSLLCVAAAVGLLRFSDLLTRMHAGTKPQVLGVLLVLVGVALRMRTGIDLGALAIIAAFQLLTIPAGAHMVGRAGFRTGQVAPTDIHLGRREAPHPRPATDPGSEPSR
ncbi:monovalent cation/H(+) antiporter subunit G [Ornithinimicrobium sp. Y1847]|uniref:monovalent cation/H(+) antiporter subunit G n=1 Tax=unclassified Ornithinimicrobium TaxID=2615080 RepID=UPI003B66B632